MPRIPPLECLMLAWRLMRLLKLFSVLAAPFDTLDNVSQQTVSKGDLQRSGDQRITMPGEDRYISFFKLPLPLLLTPHCTHNNQIFVQTVRNCLDKRGGLPEHNVKLAIPM